MEQESKFSSLTQSPATSNASTNPPTPDVFYTRNDSVNFIQGARIGNKPRLIEETSSDKTKPIGGKPFRRYNSEPKESKLNSQHSLNQTLLSNIVV